MQSGIARDQKAQERGFELPDVAGPVERHEPRPDRRRQAPALQAFPPGDALEQLTLAHSEISLRSQRGCRCDRTFRLNR
jgi:hypothetical protein